jgi:drug/metabolite transporter (DMT)-like permease
MTRSDVADAEPRSVASRTAWSHHSLLSLFVFLWGANFVLAELALREMAPISFSVARFVMGGGALVALFYAQYAIRNREQNGQEQLFPSIQTGDWPRLILVSVLGATLAPWLGIEGLGLTHGARASLWLALGPVLSSALGYLWDTERIGWAGYVGITLAGLGTFMLAADGMRPEQAYWLGDLLLVTALLMTVAELHLIKPLVARYGSVSMVALRTVIGGALYVLIATPSLVDEPWLNLSWITWVAILIGGGIGVGVGQWIKVRALDTLGPTRVVLYGNLVPVATLLLAWLTIGTDPSLLEAVAGGFIVVGAICLQVLDPHGSDAASTPSSDG